MKVDANSVCSTPKSQSYVGLPTPRPDDAFVCRGFHPENLAYTYWTGFMILPLLYTGIA